MIFTKYKQQPIKSTYVIDSKTKNLLARIKVGQVAVLSHTDIDEIAAEALIEKKVKAIVNFSSSLTGRYPTHGLLKLLKANIPVFDVNINQLNNFEKLHDNNEVCIDLMNNQVSFIGEEILYLDVEKWTIEKWDDVFRLSSRNIEYELNQFIDNTLEFASKEKEFVLKPFKIPKLKTRIKGKHVVVVVRGNNYRKDLLAIKSYIEDYRPILVGVDGGADALLENGLTPNIIIGDMDSVTNKALKSGAEIIVHAYPNGKAPGLNRIKELGIDAKTLPSVGTSEDVAMLMAYEEKAELIIALGAHSNMIDFLEKGRKGMASTVLVRMKIGTKLIDAKGVSKLYQPRVDAKAISLMGIAATTPIIAISLIDHDMVRILEIVWMNIKMLFT